MRKEVYGHKYMWASQYVRSTTGRLLLERLAFDDNQEQEIDKKTVSWALKGYYNAWDYFTVVPFAIWALNVSEATGDLVLIKTSLFLLCKPSCSYATLLAFKEKSSEVCIKAGPPPHMLAFIGQVAQHTTVKWLCYDHNCRNSCMLIG